MHRIKKNALFIIDGSYLLYRSYYAMSPLYTSTGLATQAVYGFCRAIKKVFDTFDLSHAVVVWDTKGKSFRHELLPSYKATRMAPPSDLHVQKEYIMKFLDLIGVCQLGEVGYEGDDLIAGLAKRWDDHQVVIVCADKDMYQLLDGQRVLIFDPFKPRMIDCHEFEKEWGFGPEKVPFFFALLGDASDNIPGVDGIGEKTATALVQQFTSLDDLYEHLEKVEKKRTRELLERQKDEAYLSHKLFLLNPPDVQGLRLEQTLVDRQRWWRAKPLFKELEFSSFLKEAEKHAADSVTAQGGQQASLFADDQKTDHIATPKTPWQCSVIVTEQGLEKVVDALKKHKVFALDTETTGSMPMQDSLVGISLSVDSHEAFYIPVGHQHCEQQCDVATVVAALKPILEDPNATIIMHHARFDELILQNAGINVTRAAFDTLLAANLLKNAWQKVNLKELSLFYLHEPMTKFKDLVPSNKNFSEIPLQLAAPYAAHDALQTLKLKPILEKLLDEHPKLKKILYAIEMPLSEVLLSMEKRGMIFDATIIEKVGKKVEKELEGIEEKLFAAWHHHQQRGDQKLNLKSPQQIETLLFDELKLPVIKKSKTGQRSTDHDVLLELSKVHPIPGLIVRHRELSKLNGTYILPLPTFVNPKTGRIHTSYSQTMVATGRLSSANPNLQNIPTSEEYGIGIRSAFVAQPGYVLLSADYSQIELRVLAYLTRDEALLSAFANDVDIHAQTAGQLFDVDVDKVTTVQRQLGKRINFSIIYGLTPYGLAQDLGIKPSEAKLYIEKYFERYPKVAAWLAATVQQAVKDGYTETLLGRRRYIPELQERNRNLFEAGKRMATNSPVQGTAAEIMKMAMINIYNALQEKKLDAHLVLQIHDEVIVELEGALLEQVERIVQKEMEKVVDWDVPLKVSIRTGKDWGAITK